MDETLKISIVIPVYNSKKTIAKCVESVLLQTFQFYELILINDGSLDESYVILKEIQKNNPGYNIKVINQSNSGPSSARNNGISNSKGNWIAFLDSDDEWHKNKLKKQVEILKTYRDCSIIGCDSLKKHYFKDIGSYEFASFDSFLFRNQFVTSSVIVKRDIILNHMFDESMKYAEDYKLWLNILKNNKGIVLHEKLINYGKIDESVNKDSLSSNLYKMEKGELSLFKDLYQNKFLSLPKLVLICLFSIIKFFRRVIVFKILK